MNIIIRTDASIYIGTGHVMRCLVLATGLVKIGHQVTFAMRPQQGDLIEFVQSKGFEVIALTTPSNWSMPKSSADYAAWLQLTELEDANDFSLLVGNIANIDLVIVDHYGINQVWEKEITNTLGCQIMVIDDLLREHSCHLLLDQTFGRKREEYKGLLPNSVSVITSTEYALLNPTFAKIRQKESTDTLADSSSINRHKILVMMGGIDNSNASFKVLTAIKQYISLNLHHEVQVVTVIINDKSPYYQDVVDFVSEQPDMFKQVDFVSDMASFMKLHTIAIGAPGGTSWERACLGIPNIIIPLADNQKMVCQSLMDSGAAIKVELDNLNSEFSSALIAVIKNYDDIQKNNLLLCDGLGLYRTIFAIKQLTRKKESSIFSGCRLANTNDVEQVYHWQIQPETRRFSLNTDTPTWEGHCKWMTKKLASVDNYFYIIEVKSKPDKLSAAGVVRLDHVSGSTYLLSIFIAPDFHGNGIAQHALTYIDNVHADLTINATVLSENVASVKLFTRAQYKQIAAEEFQRTPIISGL